MAHDNVRVIDWAGETAKDPALLGGDGLHLSDLGRARFAALLADELGRAPGGYGTEGECLSLARSPTTRRRARPVRRCPVRPRRRRR